MLDTPRITKLACAITNDAVALVVLLAAFVGMNWERAPKGLSEFLSLRITVESLLVILLLVLSYGGARRLFEPAEPLPPGPFWRELVPLMKAYALATGFVLISLTTWVSDTSTQRLVVYLLPAMIAASICGQVAARICGELLRSTLTRCRDLIVVGSGPRAVSLFENLQKKGKGYVRVIGFVDSPRDPLPDAAIRKRMLGSLEELEGILMSRPVDEVLIGLPTKSCYAQIQTTIQTCERAGVKATYLADIFETSLAKSSFESDGQAALVSLKVVHDDYRLLVKRCIDVVGASVGLLLFGPLMLLIAVAMRLTNHGPVLFAQERYGLNKRLFPMYKFRTMVLNAEALQADLEAQNEANGPVFKIRNDPRITSVGRALRKTSLDELPQLFNVLRGEMSLVGPRPLPRRDVARFDDASLMRRFSVKPGLTCLWQINGRSHASFARWISQDLQYIDSWSLKLDFQILARTVPIVLKGRGAS